MHLSSFVSGCIAASALFGDGASAWKTFRERMNWNHQQSYEHLLAAERDTAAAPVKNALRYNTSATSKYYVPSLPDFPFDIGELYSGQIPINTKDPSRNLFFMFHPTTGKPVDEITIWLNGGPGCSSLEGFLQENGPFTWRPGTYAPVPNPYSWVNLTNMLWVEQPVGTGFSTGKINATSQEDIAADFVAWFKNFEDVFGIKNYRIFVTGESYAGRYVPYISAAMLDKKDKTYYNLSGALVYDPCIGQFAYTQSQVPIVDLVKSNANLFSFNATFMAQLEQLNQQCGYANYTKTFYQFPPPGRQPAIPASAPSAKCDLLDLVNSAAFQNNPCFNIYEINQMCPLLWDVIAFPTELVYQPAGATVYFNRPDVKKAVHAPANVEWAECSNANVFVGPRGSGPEGEGDTSPDPIQHVLPQVIEATQRVLVSNGDYDMIIITNGTLLAIQNMTWGGQLGFQSKPVKPIVIGEPDLEYASVFAQNGAAGLDGPGQGTMGVQHYERGLMWAQTFQSGHMQPQFQPRTTYRHLLWLLGRVQEL